jgi:BirA family biotin operon repressor/biotin-[acetyl-CoA-carboxylase] ligase
MVEQMIWRVEHLVEIDSTNAWLARRAREGADEGLVVFADFQSAGRGRLERPWVAPARTSLLCSVLLRPSLEVDQVQLVVAAASLAARAALVRLCGLRPGLKWPNDLVVDDAKLAGTLAEVVADPGFAVVVGLGINLSEHPPELVATDVLAESSITMAARGLLDIVLEELEWRYALLESDEGRSRLRDEYRRALVTLGRRVVVERTNDLLEGEARDVDDSGRLIVDVDGVEVAVSTGDVVHVRPVGSAR